MPKYTPNYELFKPELTDVADITAMDSNWDKLDGKIKDLEDRIVDYSDLYDLLDGKVNRVGDTLTGSLTFNNYDAYHIFHKYRDINNTRYGVNYGCGILGGQGIVCLEVREGGETTSPMLGRLEIGDLGVSYVDSEGNRSYLVRSEVRIATVE